MARKPMSKMAFLEKCKNKFGDRFTYSSLGDYVPSRTKLSVSCSLHGESYQLPHDHLNGVHGCSVCAIDNQMTNFDSLKKVWNKTHGNKYDYRLFEYVGAHIKSIIICPNHGEFTQSPTNHRKGSGCPGCAGNTPYTLSTFIDKATTIHGNLYDYGNVVFTNIKSKIEIVCQKHGEFSQSASMHISGQGCPSCGFNVSKAETDWLDSLSIPKENRQIIMVLDDRRFKVDAYDANSNTIYEFFGGFWHGDLTRFEPNDINPRCGKTFKELHEITMNRIALFESKGYNVVYIWG